MKLASLFVLALCALPARAQDSAESETRSFALALHRSAADGRNFMISPHSLRQAMGMAFAGASGRTKEEMAAVLGEGQNFLKKEAGRRRGFSNFRGGATLRVANAIFLKTGYEFLPSFLTAVREAFEAETFVREFDQAAVGEVNRWVSRATQGTIPVMLETLDPDDRVVVLNAVYFKGQWEHPFPKEERLDGTGTMVGPLAETFRPGAGEPFPIRLMSVREKFKYFESQDYQVVRLPYLGMGLSMLIVLPTTSSSLAEFRSHLDTATWRSIGQGLESREGLVAIPRFNFDRALDMIPPLAAMGMGRAFDRATADFSAMSSPRSREDEIFIGRIVHKAGIEVDEEGTVARAVSALMSSVRGASIPQEPFRFVANRPFFFAIEYEWAETILFSGEVHDPR